jgi:hypothetical protein
MYYIQGGSNITGTSAACLHTNQSRSLAMLDSHHHRFRVWFVSTRFRYKVNYFRLLVFCCPKVQCLNLLQAFSLDVCQWQNSECGENSCWQHHNKHTRRSKQTNSWIWNYYLRTSRRIVSAPWAGKIRIQNDRIAGGGSFKFETQTTVSFIKLKGETWTKQFICCLVWFPSRTHNKEVPQYCYKRRKFSVWK